jgi:hypothetical protein
MLNHSDYYIAAIEFPYQAECPYAANVSFMSRKNGKKALAIFTGRDDWMKVAEQCRKQIASAEYVRVTHQPKPKHAPKPQAPIGKVKGGKKKGK